MDNPKVVPRKTKHGTGLFASDKISQGEVIAEFDGEIYDVDYAGWTDDLNDHVIQFEENKWRDSKGIARLINHSCEPNCGVKDLFKIVAMRNIEKGEEITWDYDMTERNRDYAWEMKCECGKESCRKIIRGYDSLPKNIKDLYKGYISDWLFGTADSL